ncbi:MAG: tetratricopeptide repeat protein [Candidatus Omnitrophota bacterium]
MKKALFWGMLMFLAVLTPLFAKEGVNRNELKELIGESYVMSQDHDSALTAYQNILKTDPGNTKARTRLADVLSWQKKYDEAVTEYKKVLGAAPEDIAVRKKLADVYVWQKDYPKALALYEGFLSRYPGDPETIVSLANTLFHLGKSDQAKELLQGVLLKDPDHATAQVLLADLAAANRDFNRAIVLYQKVLDRQYDRRLKMKIGDVQSWARHYPEALKIYDELLAEKDEKEVRLQKARILGWERKYPQAEEEYRKILEKGPDELIHGEMKAKDLYWKNRVKRAIAAYQELIRKTPENTEAMFDLSQIEAYQGMWQEAIDQYKKLLSLYAGHFRAREGLEKAELFSSHSLLTSGYEFFKAHSGARDVDIHKNAFNNRLRIPLSKGDGAGTGLSACPEVFSGPPRSDRESGPDWIQL